METKKDQHEEQTLLEYSNPTYEAWKLGVELGDVLKWNTLQSYL